MARDVTDLNGQDDLRTVVAARERVDPSDRISAGAIALDDQGESQFLRTEKRVPVRRKALDKKARSLLKTIVAVSVIVLTTVGAGWATYQYGTSSWRFRLDSSENIEIIGVHNASRAQVMDVFGIDIGRNIFSIPLDLHKSQLEQIPWVESATVMRLLPNRLAVDIRERTPVAFARIGSKINLIDANGVVLGLAPHRQTKYSFPVIEGISESEPLSSRVAVMRIYLRLERELDLEGSHYSRDLSEVDLSDPEDIKVTANGGAGSVLVHLGETDFLARYKLFATHIAEWRKQFQNLQSVDLRYDGQIVVNPDARQGTGRPPSAEQAAATSQNPGRPAIAKNQQPPRRRK